MAIPPNATQQIVGRERREREVIADFQLPIVDLIRAAASTQPLIGAQRVGGQRAAAAHQT
jgi:hypothetical protein